MRIIRRALFPMLLVIAQPLAAQTDAAILHRGLIGLPIVSADGEPMGHVTLVVQDESGPLLLVEVAQPLGLGSVPMTLHPEMFVDRGYQVELVSTAAQVRTKLKGR